MTDEIQRKVVENLEDGPLSHEALSERIYGCGDCGKVLTEEHDGVCEAVRELHREGSVNYTVDRRVTLNND